MPESPSATHDAITALDPQAEAEPSLNAGRASAAAPDPALLLERRRGRSLIGWLLIIFAQYLILRQTPLLSLPLPGRELFDGLLGVPNLDNVILGGGLLLLGGFYLARGVMPRWEQPQPFLAHAFPRTIVTASLRRIGPDLAVSLLLFAFLLWQLSVGYYDAFLAFVWIGAIILPARAAWRFDRGAGAALAPAITRGDWALMLITLLLGLAVGTYRLTLAPDSMIGDEGSFWETAYNITTGKYSPSIFGLGVYSYPVLSTIYQSWFLTWFGPSLWSWRFASVFAVALAIPATYLLARELFDRRVATVAAIIMGVTPYTIAFARLGYNNAQSLLPVVLALYLLYAGLRRSSLLYLYLSGIVAGLGFYTYTAGRLGLVVAVLALACLYGVALMRRLRRRGASAGAPSTVVALGLSLLAGWLLTAFPHIFYANRESPEMLSLKTLESVFANVTYARSIFSDTELFRDAPMVQLGTESFFYRLDLYGYLLARSLLRSALAFHHADLVTEHYIKGPLTGPWATIFYAGGLAVALSQWRKKPLGLLLLWFVVGVVLLSGISTFPPRQAHLVAIIPAMVILIALGIVAMAEFLATYAPRRRLLAQGAVAGFCVALLAYNGLYNYFVTVQAVYRPYQENIIAFNALNLAGPRQIVYIYVDPSQKDFIPWALRQIPNQATYSTVALEDLAGARLVLDPSQPYTLFFRPEDEPQVKAYALETLKGGGTLTSYYNAERQTILMSYTKP